VPIGQAPQAVVYVPDAVPHGAGTVGLQPLGVAGQAAHFTMVLSGRNIPAGTQSPTSVTLFDQGLVQVLEASVTGLEPKRPYVLALASQTNGGGEVEALSAFTTNPAGAAIVNAVGPIRQIVRADAPAQRRYLIIAPGTIGKLGQPVQVETH